MNFDDEPSSLAAGDFTMADIAAIEPGLRVPCVSIPCFILFTKIFIYCIIWARSKLI